MLSWYHIANRIISSTPSLHLLLISATIDKTPPLNISIVFRCLFPSFLLNSSLFFPSSNETFDHHILCLPLFLLFTMEKTSLSYLSNIEDALLNSSDMGINPSYRTSLLFQRCHLTALLEALKWVSICSLDTTFMANKVLHKYLIPVNN